MRKTQIRVFGFRPSRYAALLLLPIFALSPSASLAQGSDEDQTLLEDIIDWIRDILEPGDADEATPPDGEDW